MNILENKQPTLTTVGNRHFRIENLVTSIIRLDQDDQMIATNRDRPLYLKFEIEKGAVIDFRSGGPLVDFFTDQLPGNEIALWAYIIHDVLYTKCYFGEHFCSREAADEFLYKLLLLSGMSKWKAWIIHKAVRLGGKSAYDDDDRYSILNKHRFSILWTAYVN